jgi:4'-phosphopantetheinyl transferase
MDTGHPFAPLPHVAWERRLAPAAGGVHVWRIALDPHSGQDEAVLAPTELARAARFHDATRRQRYLALRLAARHILARYLGTSPHALAFGTGPRGKPHVVAPPTALMFNLTDSGALALLAVSDAGPIGVDLELLRVVPRWQAIARRSFDNDACRRLETADPQERAHLFLRHWTAHEARQKATGEGLHGARADPAQWQVLQFAPAPGWVAALAFAADVAPILSWIDYRP